MVKASSYVGFLKEDCFNGVKSESEVMVRKPPLVECPLFPARFELELVQSYLYTVRIKVKNGEPVSSLINITFFPCIGVIIVKAC
jgi:hypothetical protein